MLLVTLSQLGMDHLVTFLGCTPVQLGLMVVVATFLAALVVQLGLMLLVVYLAALGVQIALSQLGPSQFHSFVQLGHFLEIFLRC